MEDYTEFNKIVKAMANNKEFIEASEEIANHYRVPTRLVFDEEGIHMEIGGQPELPRIADIRKQIEI
jgi:hypothetical protein